MSPLLNVIHSQAGLNVNDLVALQQIEESAKANEVSLSSDYFIAVILMVNCTLFG